MGPKRASLRPEPDRFRLQALEADSLVALVNASTVWLLFAWHFDS